MKVSIWANHGSNIFGVPNNLHLTELIAILRDPCPQRIPSLSAILNTTAFAIIQIEARNPQNEMLVPVQSSTLEKRLMQQRDRQRKRSVHAGCKNSRLSRFLEILVSWSHRKIGSKAIAKRKPLAGQPCRTPLAIRNCHRSDAVFTNTLQEATEKVR